MASCASVLVLVMVMAAAAVGVVSLATPYWVASVNSILTYNEGLWQTCTGNVCTYLNKDISVWFDVVRTLYVVGVGLSIISLLFSMSYMCCHSCRTSAACAKFIVFTLLCSFCCSLVGVIVYGVKQNSDNAVKFKDAPVEFAWSFYLALCSTAACLLALLLAVCEIPNSSRMAQYEPIRPTSTHS